MKYKFDIGNIVLTKLVPENDRRVEVSPFDVWQYYGVYESLAEKPMVIIDRQKDGKFNFYRLRKANNISEIDDMWWLEQWVDELPDNYDKGRRLDYEF